MGGIDFLLSKLGSQGFWDPIFPILMSFAIERSFL